VLDHEPTLSLYWYKRKKCRCDSCMNAIAVYNVKRKELKRARARAGKIDAEPLIVFLQDKVDTSTSLARKLRRWRYEGVDPYAADAVCCEFGYHPFEIFGDEWWKGSFDE